MSCCARITPGSLLKTIKPATWPKYQLTQLSPARTHSWLISSGKPSVPFRYNTQLFTAPRAWWCSALTHAIEHLFWTSSLCLHKRVWLLFHFLQTTTLFSSEGYGTAKNLMFKDSAEKLVRLPSETDSFLYLGAEYMSIIRSLNRGTIHRSR